MTTSLSKSVLLLSSLLCASLPAQVAGTLDWTDFTDTMLLDRISGAAAGATASTTYNNANTATAIGHRMQFHTDSSVGAAYIGNDYPGTATPGANNGGDKWYAWDRNYDDALQLMTGVGGDPSGTPGHTHFFSFASPVTGLNFDIFDVGALADGLNGPAIRSVDQFTITAGLLGGGTVTPNYTLINGNTTTTLAGGTPTGDTTSPTTASPQPGFPHDHFNTEGAVDVDFGGALITSLTIEYNANGTGSTSPSGTANVHDLNFRVVPEPTSSLLVAGLGAILLLRRRR